MIRPHLVLASLTLACLASVVRGQDSISVASGCTTDAVSPWDDGVRNEVDVHSTPAIVPNDVTRGAPIYIGANVVPQFVRGSTNLNKVADASHLDAGVPDHRGTLAYTTRNCRFLGSTHGVAVLLAL